MLLPLFFEQVIGPLAGEEAADHRRQKATQERRPGHDKFIVHVFDDAEFRQQGVQEKMNDKITNITENSGDDKRYPRKHAPRQAMELPDGRSLTS